jgi:hypothetical protein
MTFNLDDDSWTTFADLRQFLTRSLNADGTLRSTAATTVDPIALYATDYGFEANANGQNVDDEWDNLIAAATGSTPSGTTIYFPAGIFDLTETKNIGTIKHLRLVGVGGSGDQTNNLQSDTRYRRTTFRLNTTGVDTLFDIDGGNNTVVKAGPVFEFLNFYNAGDSTADCFYINNVNDGVFRCCSAQDFRYVFHLEATGASGDNAHWSVYDFMSYSNEQLLHAVECYGWNFFGGEAIGTTGEGPCFWIGEDANEISVFGTKAVGFGEGYAYIAGGNCSFFGARAENCGDTDSPVVDIQRTGDGTSGFRNGFYGYRFSDNASNRLPARMGASTASNCFIGGTHSTFGTHVSLSANGEILNSGNSQNNVIIDSEVISLNTRQKSPMQFVEISAPSSPSSNAVYIYAKDDAGTTKLYYKRSDGTEVVWE